jgi:ligand-binding SRPBCC domain-containing protein
MRFRHSFRIRAPLAQVAAFHRQSRSMGAITPPPAIVRLHRAPPELGEGDEMEFTIWMGPLPIRWKARIEQVSLQGFTDRQLRGPFKEWVHRHSFHTTDAQTTEIQDDVQARLRLHPLWGPVGLGMWLSLPVMFAYRAWKTRQLLRENGQK